MFKKSAYYNEIGIKISSFRLSVRFPTGEPAVTTQDSNQGPEEFDYGAICKKVDHYRSDWKWVPVRNENTKVLSKPCRPLPPPPVPPRAASPSAPPTSALPPYPSSTVSRKSSKSSRCSSTSSSRISSYVWFGFQHPPLLEKMEDYLSTLIYHHVNIIHSERKKVTLLYNCYKYLNHA